VSDGAFVKVRYSCWLCGVRQREVLVPARGEEDAGAWLKGTCMPRVRADHANVSTSCPAESVDVIIPMAGADKVGGVAKQ
jgi:hypothetical protein